MPERTTDRAAFLGDQLLIAMPAMADPHFDHAVTYICEHGPEGALGIVINRPLGLTLGAVLSQLELGCDDPATRARTVFFGGPVLPERGFVLHDSGSRFDSTLRVNERFSVTTSRDVLAAIADGRGPQQALIALGYAGWSAGQLEAELADNAWLSAPADPLLVFDTPPEQRWDRAARSIGADPARLSGAAGHA
jgi:putative transcriptional regulator